MDQVVAVNRKQTDEREEESNKKTIEENADECYLTELPECLLHVILSYFDASSLYNISQTCCLFNEMAKRPVFWRFIDARNPPEDPNKFVYCYQRLNERTTHFLYKGKRWNVMLQKPMFDNMSAWCNLKVLALENVYFQQNTRVLEYVPKSLEELSLRLSCIEDGDGFFLHSPRLERLRVLILDECPWFEASSLVLIASLKNLEILSMYKCKRLCENNDLYVKLWGKYGPKNIKIIDVRHTSLGNVMIKYMYKSITLQELYFQCYSSTYQLDKMKRKLAIHRGAKREAHAQESEDESNVDTNKQRFYKRFQMARLLKSRTDALDDNAISRYRHVENVDEKPKRPESFLFKYPYAECKCGFSPISWANKTCAATRKADSEPSSDDTDDDDDETKRLKRKILKRRRQLRTMLKNFHAPPVYYAPHNAQGLRWGLAARLRWMLEREPQVEQEITMLQYFALETQPYELFDEYSFVLNTRAESDESSDEEVMEEQYVPGQPSEWLRMPHEPDAIPRIALNVLCLRGYPKITDATLGHLENVNLHLLDVSYTNVTRRGLIDFMKKHPDCRVVHESACTCGPRMHF